MRRVVWSNGHEDAARSWTALLEVVRVTQLRVVPMDKFRQELAHRAWVWSGHDVDPYASPQDLFEQLEQAHLLKIVPASGTMFKTTNDERTD